MKFLLALSGLALVSAMDITEMPDAPGYDAFLRTKNDKKASRGGNVAVKNGKRDGPGKTEAKKAGKQDPTLERGSFTWGYHIRDKNLNRVRVANGVTGRPIAYIGEPVVLADGSNSSIPYQLAPDGGAVIMKDDGSGFYYINNSEEGDIDNPIGGVYVIETDLDHNPIDYYQVLSGTISNCAGGKTPWGTWVTCEEEKGTGPEHGYCIQVDPANKDQKGATKPERTAVTPYPANWESFAWDDYDWPPRGYATDDAAPEDAPDAYGAVTRFTPDDAALECYAGSTKEERWCTLNSGTHDYLKLNRVDGTNCGTIEWVSDPADSSAGSYRNNEGIDITPDGILHFTAKKDRQLFKVDLRGETYCQWSTLAGFPQEPDTIRSLGDVLYFCNDGRTPNGIFGLDSEGYFGLLMEIDYTTETAGLAFSPDGMYMYVSFQEAATWQFWREDGLPFDAKPASTTYVKTDGNVYDMEIVLDKIIAAVVNEILSGEES